MRQAAIALLAVPVLVVVYAALAAASVGGRLRRSKAIRVSFALGLALIVGIGIVGTGRPSPAVATAPVPIVPLTPAAFTTQVVTDRALTEPVSIRFSTAMDPASVAAAITVDPPTPVSLAWDATGTVLMIAPRDHWAAGTLHTITVQPGALARSGQPLVSPARAAFLTRDATTASAAATQPVGDKVAVTTAVRRHVRPPGRARDRRRRDPSRPADPRDRRADQQPGRRHALQLQPEADAPPRRRVSTDRVRRPRHRRPAARHRGSRRPDRQGSRRGALPPARWHDRCRTRRRDLGPFQRGDGPAEHRGARSPCRSAASPSPGTVSWAEHDTVLVFKPKSALPAGLDACRWTSPSAPRPSSGAALVQPVHGAFQTAATTQTGPAGSVLELGRLWRRGRRGRWWQLGLGRDLLPRADELHADRRLGHLDGRLQQPGRAQRRAAQARQRDQLEGQPALRQEDRDRQRMQPFHRREPGRPPAPRGLHELSLGREHRLPVRQPTRRGPGHATSSSRARSHTAAATTST